MKTTKQKRAIEALAILCTVFGTYMISTLVLVLFGGVTYTGYELTLKELALYVLWYVLSGYLLALAHPNPNRRLMVTISVIIVVFLFATSSTWIDPALGWYETISIWLFSGINYLIVLPIFWTIGHFAEHATKESATNT